MGCTRRLSWRCTKVLELWVHKDGKVGVREDGRIGSCGCAKTVELGHAKTVELGHTSARCVTMARSTRVTMAHGGIKQYAIHCAPLQPNTLRPSDRMRSSKARSLRSCRRQLVLLSKYRMCQRTTAVNQPPFPPVFNAADNALDRFNVSRVQGPPL